MKLDGANLTLETEGFTGAVNVDDLTSIHFENLEAEVNGIIRPVQDDPGYGIMYELKWNFQNGLTIAAGGIFFTGNDDDLLEFFDKKDMVFIEGKMEF